MTFLTCLLQHLLAGIHVPGAQIKMKHLMKMIHICQTSSQDLFSKIKKIIRQRTNPACLRKPYLTPLKDGDEYYYMFLFLFAPWRDEKELITGPL